MSNISSSAMLPGNNDNNGEQKTAATFIVQAFYHTKPRLPNFWPQKTGRFPHTCLTVSCPRFHSSSRLFCHFIACCSNCLMKISATWPQFVPRVRPRFRFIFTSRLCSSESPKWCCSNRSWRTVMFHKQQCFPNRKQRPWHLKFRETSIL